LNLRQAPGRQNLPPRRIAVRNATGLGIAQQETQTTGISTGI
jgi:hypothetical protein